MTLNDLAHVCLDEGDADRAAPFLEEGIALSGSVGGGLQGSRLTLYLGHARRLQGEDAAAAACYSTALEEASARGDLTTVAVALHAAAALIGARGDAVTAARVLGAAGAISVGQARRPPTAIRERAAVDIERARARLGDRTFEQFATEGSALPLDEASAAAVSALRAIVVARRQDRTEQDHRYPDGLTDREVEVLRLIAAGQSTRAIADALVIADKTVERHVSNLYGKIGAQNRAEATAYAFRHALAHPTDA
jgi:DNA-binding CsgD family transcriptional regulator